IWRAQCDFLYAPGMARRGYAVLTMDCRGYGSSGDAVFCADPDHELNDISDLITWITSTKSPVKVDPDHIGITGVSYGGGFSFLMPAYDERIAAAVPMNGWTDLARSLLPDGSWKFAWSMLLFVAAVWGMKRDYNGELAYWLKTVWNGNFDEVDDRIGGRGAINRIDDIKCPMFIVHSWNDDLFQPNQILDFYEKFNKPKKLYMTNGIHGFDGGRGDFLVRNEAWEKTRRFFDYWLKDEKDNGIMDEPAVEYFQPWDGRMAKTTNWPPPDLALRDYFLRRKPGSEKHEGFLSAEKPDRNEPPGLLINNTVSSLHTSGPPMLRLNALFNLPIPGVPWSISKDSIMFDTSPLEESVEIVGAPSVDLYVSSSSGECQLNVLLYDVRPSGFARLITYGAATKRDVKPGDVNNYRFELVACAHRLKAGHRLRAVLCAANPLHVKPSSIPSAYEVLHDDKFPSGISMPIIVEGAGKAGKAKKPAAKKAGAEKKPAAKKARAAGKPAAKKAGAGKAAEKPARAAVKSGGSAKKQGKSAGKPSGRGKKAEKAGKASKKPSKPAI
ncbi:MAG: CocE/NonD family hydrolase, partial [Actinobacteria bacterium]|nr:CocE/NonD family hydrolase [Actinomycetota bacterium]